MPSCSWSIRTLTRAKAASQSLVRDRVAKHRAGVGSRVPRPASAAEFLRRFSPAHRAQLMEYQGVSLGELTALTAETALGTEFTPEPPAPTPQTLSALDVGGKLRRPWSSACVCPLMTLLAEGGSGPLTAQAVTYLSLKAGRAFCPLHRHTHKLQHPPLQCCGFSGCAACPQFEVRIFHWPPVLSYPSSTSRQPAGLKAQPEVWPPPAAERRPFLSLCSCW